MRLLLAAAAVVGLTACVNVTPLSLPNGHQGFSINCPAQGGMVGCLQKAGDLCGPSGYDIHMTGGDNTDFVFSNGRTTTFGNVQRSNILVECRGAGAVAMQPNVPAPESAATAPKWVDCKLPGKEPEIATGAGCQSIGGVASIPTLSDAIDPALAAHGCSFKFVNGAPGHVAEGEGYYRASDKRQWACHNGHMFWRDTGELR